MTRLKIISVCAIVVLMTSCDRTKKTQKESKFIKPQKETYVLVHSAWLGGWQWDNTAKILRENGHTV